MAVRVREKGRGKTHVVNRDSRVLQRPRLPPPNPALRGPQKLVLNRHLHDGKDLGVQRVDLVPQRLHLPGVRGARAQGRSAQGLEVRPVEAAPRRLDGALDQPALC